MVHSAPFDALATSMFTDPTLTESVTYAGTTIQAIRSTRTADFRFDGTALRSDAITFKVLAADVPNPAEGDPITAADGSTWTVQGAPTRIMRGLAWLVEAVPA